MQTDNHWGKIQSQISIDEELPEGLCGISSFSHILVAYDLNEAKFIKEENLISFNERLLLIFSVSYVYRYKQRN